MIRNQTPELLCGIEQRRQRLESAGENARGGGVTDNPIPNSNANPKSVLNIGLFQFSSQISVTLVSVLFTPPLANPIYQQLSR